MPLSLAERIAWILSARAMNPRQLSLKSGLSHTYVGFLLKGTKTNLTTSSGAKLAEAAGVDLNWLLTGEGLPEPGAIVGGVEPPALTQALALLGDRLAQPVKTALRAERPAQAWTVEQWIDRGLHLRGVYEKLPQK